MRTIGAIFVLALATIAFISMASVRVASPFTPTGVVTLYAAEQIIGDAGEFRVVKQFSHQDVIASGGTSIRSGGREWAK
jgi:hypothetical protein